MEIMFVRPKDVYVAIEFSLAELKQILLALDLANIEFNGTKSEEVEAANFVTQKLYPNLKTVITEVEKNNGS